MNVSKGDSNDSARGNNFAPTAGSGGPTTLSFQPVSKYTRQLMEQQNQYDFKNELPTRLDNNSNF